MLTPTSLRNGHRLARSVCQSACTALLSCGLLTSCQPAKRDLTAEAPSDQELARVGSQIITADAFLAERARASTTESNSELLDRLLQRELLFAEASRTGFDQSPELKAAWKNLVSQRYRESLEARDDITPLSEDEIRSEYANHPERYTSAPQRRIALIQLPATLPGARVQEIRTEAIRTAADTVHFGPLATHSFHPSSRQNGGDLGWLTLAQADLAFPSEVVTALFALNTPGEVSAPIPTSEGIFVLKLMEVRPGNPKPYDAVRDAIAYSLRRQQRQLAEQQRVAHLRSLHPIQVHPERLAELTPPAPAVAVRPPRLP
ncbi:MAG: peptidyl-prolyl cis-trans isomerase [Verrucomicrobia bacterium]|nr:peptidyl-prolyl cis-trans isomerase [Verrucomicrobiota bacterium]